MSETISQFWQRIGFKPGGKSGGRVSDDDVNQNALDAEAREFRVLRDRSITYRNRRGESVTVAPGEPGYIEARSELSMPQLSELNRLNEENMQRAIDIGQTAAMRSFAEDRDLISSPVRDSPSVFDVARTPISMQDPVEFEFGESLTDLGVKEQRAIEREDARAQQDYLNKEFERLVGELKTAEQALKSSIDAQARFAAGQTDIETLKERGLLERRQMEFDLKKEQAEQARSSLMDTTYIIDPSRAKQTISGYLTDLSENVIPKLEDEISTIESTLQDPSIARPGSEASNIFRGDKFATRPVLLPSEIASIRRHNDLKELLKKKQDELSKAKSNVRKYRGQIELLPETLPLQDYEKEEISKLGPYEIRSLDIDEDRYSAPYAPNIKGDPFASGLPMLPEREITGEPYLIDPETGLRDFTFTKPLSDEEHRRIYPEDYEDESLPLKISEPLSNDDDELLSQSMLTDLNEDSGMSRRKPTDAQMNRRMKMAEYDMFGPGRSEVIRGTGFMSDKDGVANKENEDSGASPSMP